LRGAQNVTKLDLSNSYNLIQIKEAEENQTSFHARYRKFEYRVIPFGLTTAPATLQAYIDDCLQPYIDDFGVCYIDDILIFLTDEEEHEEQLRTVLKQLGDFGP
jgi:hypothetical protein